MHMVVVFKNKSNSVCIGLLWFAFLVSLKVRNSEIFNLPQGNTLLNPVSVA